MPSMEYMPPPVLPHMASINPLRLRRRSRSRNGSLSSTSENLTPEVAAGYEADLDYPDREIKKSTGRPQHLIASAMASTVHQLSPRRPNNHNRPSPPLIQNPEPASSSFNSCDRARSQRKEDKYLSATPTQSQSQPLHLLQPAPPSPNRSSFTSPDEPIVFQNPALHSRKGSETDADRLLTWKTAENADNPTMPFRRVGPDNLSFGKSRLESSRVIVNEPPSRRPYDDEDTWEVVPSNLVQRHADEQERMSPTILRKPGISRQRPTSPYTSRNNRHIINNPPTRAPPTAPSAVQETRTTTQTRPARLPLTHNVFVTWKGEEGGTRKASPASVPSSSSRLVKNGTKSMDNLKLSISPSGRRNPLRFPIARPPVAVPSVPKTYESNFVRHLPGQGSSYGPSSDVQGSSIHYNSRTYSSNHISPSQDLPRPQSATEDPLSLTTQSYTRPQYGPTLGETNISPRSVSPLRGYHSPGIPGPRPRPTHHSDRSSDMQSGPETTNSTSPHTPNSPHRHDPAHGFDLSPPSSLSTASTSGSRSSDATLKQEDQLHFAHLLGQMAQDDKTHVVLQTPEPEKTLRQLTPPSPSAPRNSFGLEYDDDDDESDDGGGTWIRRPDPPKTSRPPLKVQIDSAISQKSADTVISQDTPPASHLLNSTSALDQPPTIARPGSTFIDADGDSWAPRPPPENIYDRLDQFFSKHDLDKPVIEAISGDTSPTAEPAIPPPNSVNDNKARIRAKKSIRIVAEEHKKRIDRTSMADPAAFANNVLRKRNTKLWGSKLEELTTFRSNSTPSLPESPSSGPSKGIIFCGHFFPLFVLIKLPQLRSSGCVVNLLDKERMVECTWPSMQQLERWLLWSKSSCHGLRVIKMILVNMLSSKPWKWKVRHWKTSTIPILYNILALKKRLQI